MSNPPTRFLGPIMQIPAKASQTFILAPAFSGVQTITANADGSISVSWSAATAGNPTPYTYWVYIQVVTATGIYTQIPFETQALSMKLYVDTAMNPLVKGSTYYIAVRVADRVGNVDNNIVVLNAVSQGVPDNSITNKLNQLISTVGSPAGASVSADIAQVEANVLNIKNGLVAQVDVEARIILPISGAKTYPLRIRLVNNQGLNVDPDGGSPTVNISILNAAGTTILASTAMTRSTLGVYRYDYSVLSTDTPQVLLVQFDFTYLGVALVRRQSSESVSELQLLTATKSQTDKLSFDGSNNILSKVIINADKTGYDLGTTDRASIAAIPTNPQLAPTALTQYNILVAALAAIPTNPQLASVALSQYNSLVSALGSIQNNTNFSGIVPQVMDIPETGSSSFTFYGNIFNSTGMPEDPDSNVLNFTVKDSAGNVLQAQSAMTRNGAGKYQGAFVVLSTDLTTDVVVFFNYSVSSTSYEQIRTSRISDEDELSSNILAIKEQTDKLGFDLSNNVKANAEVVSDKTGYSPDSTTVSRISAIKAQTDQFLFDGSSNVKANAEVVSDKTGYGLSIGERQSIATEVWGALRSANLASGSFGEALQGVLSASRAGLLDNLSNLDYRSSLLSTQTSVNALASAIAAIPTNPLLTNDSRLTNLFSRVDVSISSRSTDADMQTLLTRLSAARALLLDNLQYLNAPITGIATDADMQTLLARLTSTRANLLDNLSNLDATISSRLSSTDSRLVYLDYSIAAIAAHIDNQLITDSIIDVEFDDEDSVNNV